MTENLLRCKLLFLTLIVTLDIIEGKAYKMLRKHLVPSPSVDKLVYLSHLILLLYVVFLFPKKEQVFFLVVYFNYKQALMIHHNFLVLMLILLVIVSSLWPMV